MSSTYGRSPGGYVWALIEPLGGIVVIAVGFSFLVRQPPLGVSFLLFYATGMLPLHMYMTVSNRVGAALRSARPLLAYPRVVWVDAVVASFILIMLTQITVFLILISGILALIDTKTVVDIVPMIEGLGLVAAFGLGVGLINCVLFELFPIWRSLWGIASRPMFLVSGVIFLYESAPPVAQSVMWWNPVLHAVSWVRTGLYPTYHGDFVSLAYGYGVSLVLIAIGLLLIRRHHRTILEL